MSHLRGSLFKWMFYVGLGNLKVSLQMSHRISFTEFFLMFCIDFFFTKCLTTSLTFMRHFPLEMSLIKSLDQTLTNSSLMNLFSRFTKKNDQDKYSLVLLEYLSKGYRYLSLASWALQSISFVLAICCVKSLSLNFHGKRRLHKSHTWIST